MQLLKFVVPRARIVFGQTYMEKVIREKKYYFRFKSEIHNQQKCVNDYKNYPSLSTSITFNLILFH